MTLKLDESWKKVKFICNIYCITYVNNTFNIRLFIYNINFTLAFGEIFIIYRVTIRVLNSFDKDQNNYGYNSLSRILNDMEIPQSAQYFT